MNINIRLETPADHYAVEEITREAFWAFWEPDATICAEHLLVHKLRTVESYVPELDFVAEYDGKIVGHIIYTKSKIACDDGVEYETLTFGPLTVAPECQNMGIGKKLMRHSFDEAKRLGYRAVLIFGHPDYYPRVGFRRAAEFGVTPTSGDIRDPFMAYPLYDGALDGIQGRYLIDPVYEQLAEADVLEFDKRFPPKEPFFTTPIGILLDKLDPKPRKALEDTGCVSLEMMTSISEREISSLPGMDAESVETIRATLHGHGMRWGE